MSYIVIAPTEDETDDIKDSFFEELEHVFDKFPKYHMKVLLGDFSAKVCRKAIFKPTVGSKILHEINNDNGVRVLNFTTSINLIDQSTMFSHHNINLLAHFLVDRCTIRLTTF
jgi:hypothetical protein